MGYEHDIFLSYPRQGTVGQWVSEVFHPELCDALADHCRSARKVFFDSDDMENGGCLPDKLAHALQRSRCLVTVWCPRYFERPWCDAEWKSMRAREALLGLGGDSRPGLIYPVVFGDGIHFPPEAADTLQKKDLKRYGGLRSASKGDKLYRKLRDEIRQICEDLDRWTLAAPPWQPDWPVLLPDPVPAATPPNPNSTDLS